MRAMIAAALLSAGIAMPSVSQEASGTSDASSSGESILSARAPASEAAGPLDALNFMAGCWRSDFSGGAVLEDDVSEMPKNWNRRFKHNREKIKTGDIYELAEVVRNLAIREQDKGLSTGEKQMYTRAKKILASELMYALEKSEDEAEAYLDQVLTRENLAASA